jgi:hypothetical protein
MVVTVGVEPRLRPSRIQTLSLGGLASCCLAAGFLMVVSPDATWILRIVGVAIGMAAGLALVRVIRVGVTSNSRGVDVVTWTRTRHVPWNDIETFSVRSGNNAVQPTHTLFIDLKGGTQVRVQVVSASGWLRAPTYVHRGADELNKRLLNG